VPWREISYVGTLHKGADFFLDRELMTCELATCGLTEVGTRSDRDHAAGHRNGLTSGYHEVCSALRWK
jgi:hypothetical protein